KKVKKIAEELGYHPNIMARCLVQQRSFMLGVVVPNLRISFFSEVTRGIYERARERGYEAIIMVNDENPEVEKRNLQFLSALAVDGILIDAVPGEHNKALFERLVSQRIPLVAYDRLVDGIWLDSVTIDDEKACYDVVTRLYEQGRKHVTFLGPTEKLFVAKGRYRGYRKALKEYKLDYDSRRVIPCEIDPLDAERKTNEALAAGISMDAIICVGGQVAYGAGKAILKRNLNIPGDIMLAEFGDNDIVARLGVPFLTVYQHPYEMGIQAVDLILKKINSSIANSPSEHVIINTQLIYHEIGIQHQSAQPV
ncbi:MAG: LacI family transcriptional regulator, partial [Calditrichaeota bacterium]